MVGNHKTPLQQVLETDVEREQLLKEQEELSSSEHVEDADFRLGEIYKRLNEIDAHHAESKAATILGGLGFSKEMMSGPTEMLSGGWRMRVSLARALFV